MEWHIVTGSKGGVGKTLLTLLLLAYHLEESTNEGILVFDLNAMNTDTSALLLYNKKFTKRTAIQLESSKRIITLQRTYSQTTSQQTTHFAVGWSENPFLWYGFDDFIELLAGVKEHAQEIADKLEIKSLKHVFIDTNHHFCNLFPSQDEDYKKYHDIFETENITIWFLWVYRQLKKLLDNDDSETQILKQTVGAIERIFEPIKSEQLGPLVHTYTPVGLPTDPGAMGGLLSKIWNINLTKTDFVIKELMKLEKLEEVGNYVGFNQWIEQLQQAKTEISNSQNRNSDQHRNSDQQNTHQFFGDMLYKAVERLVGDDCLPINIFPLSIYQPTLEGYTDKEREDAVANLRKLDTYKHFKKLLNRKFMKRG